MEFRHFHGRCFFCRKGFGAYNPAGQRHCCASELPQDVARQFGSALSLYPTIFPVPADGLAPFDPPSPRATPIYDVLAVDVAVAGEHRHVEPLPVLPGHQAPSLQLLRCGNATVYNLGHRAASFMFKENTVSVCDMTTYFWSNTLKDPRSWAVVQTAAAYGIRHLGVWTAGNAGLSVAKIAYAVNQALPPSKRIHVHCYGVRNELPIEHQWQMERFGAEVVYLESVKGGIFQPTDALKKLNARRSPEAQIDANDYWEVSDGWDGLALHMYRLLGLQLCRYYKPDFIVVPVGTGDLFYGLWLGRKEAETAGHITRKQCRLVAAVPQGRSSVLANYAQYQLQIPARPPTMGTKAPMAPKLATNYTPLLLVMYLALIDPLVRVVLVSDQEQEWAASLLMTRGAHPWVTAEPSAMLGFAALRNVARVVLEEDSGSPSGHDATANAQIMVINSGCGLIGKDEISFLQPILGRPATA